MKNKITNPIIGLMIYIILFLWHIVLMILPLVILKACCVYLMG